jgi:serine/threonine-protein kinase
VRAPAEDDYTGRIVAGKFRVEQLIGEGGMGKVFRATQLSLDKTVVLKVLRQSLLSDARTVARFQREAKAASRLNHPNSISVIDFGQGDDGSLYIAMEHVSGIDLHQLLSNEGPLDERRIGHIIAQVLSALSDAHAAGVIHRDLKPENIMVENRRGERDFVKVLDFGIAKITDTDGSEGQALTRAGFVCGTPEYMSPEQARGAMLDPRSDLYAVGVILYQCATNKLPFEADSAVGLATMHLTTPPTPPRERGGHISEALEALILKALAKDPNDRPQSAEEFRSDLLAAVQAAQATRVQAMPTMPVRDSARRPSRSAARAVDDEATSLSRTPSWASSPGTFSEEATVAATLPGTPARLRRNSTKAIALGVGIAAGVALLGSAAFLGYRHVSGNSTPRIADIPEPIPAASDLAPIKEPPSDLSLVREGSDAAGGPARSKARDLLDSGDRAVAARDWDAALLHYARSYENDPGPTASKRLALGYMLKGDSANSDKWLRQYLQEAGKTADREYIERFLRAQ